MAATTTPSISWLLPKLNAHYPEIAFQASDVCAWNPVDRVIYYHDAPDEGWRLLHELGHALLEHDSYSRDIELIGYERDAWQQAQVIAGELSLVIPDDVIDEHMDTYRDWLHARSRCVACAQTGLQVAEREYQCPHCDTRWRVNDARTCALRRYKVQ